MEYAYYNSPNIGYFGIEGKRVVFPLVSKLSEPNGLGGVTETIFTYGQAFYDFDRRQLMGFGQFNSYCNGTNTMMNYEYNDTYHHLNLEHALTYYLERGNNPVRGYVDDTSYWENNRNIFYYYEILNTLAYQGLSYNRFIPYYSYSSTIDKLQNRQQRKCSWLNASDGRLENSSVVNIDYESLLWLSRDSTHYTYTETTLHNGQTVNKISSTKTWNERNGFTQKPYQEVNYLYSTEGRLSTKTVSDSDGLIGVTAYSYNYLGFPTSETYTPNGLTARSRSFGYSNNYRFLTRETDALGHIQSVTFDDKTGLMTTQTDVNGLTTEFQYDALGRLTDVVRPDRTEHHIRYYWNDVSSFSNSVYYKREFEDGQPTTSTYYDILGRTIHTHVAGKGYDDIVYNDLGLVSKTTYVPYETPSTFSSNKIWHNNNYDQYNRIIWETDPYTNMSFVYYDYNNASMHEYFVTVTDSIRDTQQTKKYDALGRLTQATDEGGTINYSYSYLTEDNEIIDKLCVVVGVDTTTIKSDIRGNRLSIQDPDGGTVTNTYNALNQLTHQTNANSNQTEYTYDLGGRTTQIVYSHGIDSETISYTYDNASGSGIGKLASVKKNGSNDCVFFYDELGRILNRKVYDGNSDYDHQYEYNNLGQLQYFTYPDSYCIEMVYNSYGELKQINNAADNSMIYATDTRNRFRQPLKCRYGNETGVQYTYNAYGMLTGIRNGDVVENNNIHNFGHSTDPDEDYTINTQYRQLSYTYNARGFIDTRTDAKVNQSESYFYDKLDRLESYKVNGTTAASFLYEPTGNIHTHSKVGTYSYDENKTHAVVGIVGNSSCPIPASECDVNYNFRDRPTSIAENGYSITLDYDAAGMRRHTRYYQGIAMQKSKARISDVYEVELGSGAQRKLDYIYAEGQLVAVHVKRGTADSLYYVMTDHLGSWNKVMDEDKNIVQQTHFDPWGNRMSYTAWNTPQTQISFPFSRGFTGHEHYDRFKIINANARLYDPVIGRFFSPDPFVQAPNFTQNYNRYSYCLNNPVMYTDPNGNFIIFDAFISGFLQGFIGSKENRITNGGQKAVQFAKNDAKILGGLFRPDFNKGFFGRNWDVLSRLTWEFPQTKVGLTFALFSNLCGQVDNVEYYDGTTVSSGNNFGIGGAVTLGSYINGEKELSANPENNLFQHEYGHYLQSKATGPMYLSRYAIPSGLNGLGNKNHNLHPVEQDANIRAYKYFNKRFSDFSSWDFDKNPIIGYKEFLPMTDEINQIALQNGHLQPRWYDYILFLSPTTDVVETIITLGIINWIFLEDYKVY